ncbi:hypothetical protein LAG90_09040 [Marinilongibacter aquaticus]|uniref:Cas10/Cmr2 second palm domain-containing protein n=1 Tax=Marinilongibacter aquaticus TaxID=2975157 RepID=UPI0021BDD359|nr:hypothetical protein [Marinilongibacter aquaticus]UBM60779.1 hypothetical protein LAG90_09040 [Marinilongibacter aquaticus]
MNYLYGLTIQGIQSYIFQTNNLREIIGGSELIESICTSYFTEFIGKKENEISGNILLNAAGNIRFQTSMECAQKIYKEFGWQLLQKAPGVPYSQAVVQIKSERNAILEIDEALRIQRNVLQHKVDLNYMGRMLARTTGDAAVNISGYSDKKRQSLDAATLNKFLLGGDAELIKLKISDPEVKFAKGFSDIAKGGKHSWLALVHIDGNGMGNIIQKILGDSDRPFNDLNDFSQAVENSTISAFKDALKLIKYNSVLPFRPLVLGGDDVTAIMRADLALKFCETYLQKFEYYTKQNLKENEHAPDGLTACAGIAFVKEKFPFHYSAHLAEELCSHAKKESNRKLSCLMFHRVQDSFISDFDEILERELTYGKEVLAGGPYFINNVSGKPQIGKLLNDVKQLFEEDSPKNAMREWVDAALKGSGLEETLKERMEAKYDKPNFKDLIKDYHRYNDYLTLLSISNG